VNKEKVEDIYELSPLQEGMLFHCLATPESGVYVSRFFFTLKGKLDIPAFEQSWQFVVNRHSVLRTSFHWKKIKNPMQVVRRNQEIIFHYQDLREFSKLEQAQYLDDYMKVEGRKGFNLARPPLIRFALFQCDELTYEFAVTIHHLILDGTSLGLLLDEVFGYYEDIAHGKSIQNVEPGTPYSAYIRWLREQDEYDAEVFWKNYLKGFDTPNSIAASHYVQDNFIGEENEFGEQEVQFSEKMATELQALAKNCRVTFNTVVQSAWTILLARYSNQDDVIFGSVISTRPPAISNVEAILGLLINTVPVRVKLSPDDNLPDFLKKLQLEQIRTREYSYCSLVQIQQWSEISGGRSLFESIVNCEDGRSIKARRLDGLKQQKGRAYDWTNYPLSIIVRSGSQLNLVIKYDSRKYDKDFIQRIFGHLQILLENLIAKPEGCIGDLPILSECEQHQLLIDWNDTTTDYPTGLCVHQLFEKQAAQTPDAIALVFEGQHCTYHELNERSNQLAHYLCKRGVKAGGFVCISMDRSIDMIIGFLGILKAGSAYVPLDLDYPQDRLSFMLQDTRAHVLLTTSHLSGYFDEVDCQVICMDAEGDVISRQSKNNLSHTGGSQDIAYVIYTSGSTGKPKGVLVPHQAITRLVRNTNYIAFDGSEIIAQASNTSFDAATFEIWGALLNGGKLVHIPKETLLSPKLMIEHIRQHGITTMFLTTALFNQIVSEIPSGFQTLRHLLFGGEAVNPEYVRSVLKSGAPQNLLHVYGPTENTTFSTWYKIKDVAKYAQTVPIGMPIANSTHYVLDGKSNLVPVGVPGELCVGGDGLAKGYLNQPELTAEKFIPNPFGHDSEARLYKTGDLVRYLPDGNIEFIGRIDNQVKIRGFRIELGEIESILRGHDSVDDAVVTVWEGQGQGQRDDKRLVAYVVLTEVAVDGWIAPILKSYCPSIWFRPVLPDWKNFR
jgi:amino acid adenylation domain-containing protein